MSAPNPYKSPSSSVADRATSRSLLSAVFLAFLCSVGLSYVLQTLSGVTLSWMLVHRGVRVEDLYSAMSDSALINALSHTLNAISIAIGGGLSAWLSPGRGVSPAAAVGGLLLCFAVFQLFVPYEHQAPGWSVLLSLLTPVPAAVGGALLWGRYAA